MNRRVVITGIGVISSIGTGKDSFFDGLLNGKNGKKDIPYFDTEKYSMKKACIVEGFNEKEYHLKDNSIEIEPANVYALYASKQAIEDAGLKKGDYEDIRKGVAVATSLASINGKSLIHHQILDGEEYDKVNFDAAFESCSTPTGVICKEFSCLGPNCSVSTACAAGTNSIGCGYDMIKNDECDMVISGGCDPFDQMSFSGFLSLMTITKKECTPFDANRSGIDIGEGAAILILEELESALKRGAKIYAEVLGYGLANDAYHATSPDPSGNGAKLCMKMSMDEAGIGVNDIDYINAHGTGTKINDKMEINVIKDLFSDNANNVYISSTKSMHGHMLGATGSIEVAACALALYNGVIPPTTKTTQLMEECEGINIILNYPVKKKIKYALSNSFGFAGNCSSIVIGRFE